jgi:hypothetical protein
MGLSADTEGLRFFSTGVCPGCEECKEQGFSDEVGDEGNFSNTTCGLCGDHLAGHRYIYHWVDEENNIIHEDDACFACVIEVNNGERPE